jgi:putative polyhydroxyalkanoate system protein
MPDINISRQHTLGLPAARKIAYKWADDCEKKLDMNCTYEEGKASDEVQFKRSGVEGTLAVTATGFELYAKLGFLLGAFKGKIESEIEKNLDVLLAKSAEKSTVAAKKAAAKKKA